MDTTAKEIAEMSDREILEEILTHMRAVDTALAEFQETPIMQTLKNGGNPLMAIMGR